MKKMRRLIPAIAMLLVSAVMLSTASFAWFTMNDSVSATGMSVQAKASGSMIIGENKLTELDNGIKVDFATKGNTTITPLTYKKDEGGFVIPNNGEDVDPLTGKYEGGWKAATLANGTNCVMYTVYIAVAGDSVDGNIEATVTVDTEVNITKAYTIAFFVNETDNAILGGTATPTNTINVLDGESETKDRKIFADYMTIPSTIGVTDAANGVGIKVTMIVYVDGDLASTSTVDVKEPSYELATTYDSTATYYTKSTVDGKDVYTLAPSANLGLNDGDALTNRQWYLYKGMVATGEKATVYYVNNAWAPSTPSGLNVEFGLIEKPAATEAATEAPTEEPQG